MVEGYLGRARGDRRITSVIQMSTIHQKGMLYLLTIPQFLKCAKGYIYSQNSFRGLLAVMIDTTILGIHGRRSLFFKTSFGFSELCSLVTT